MKPYYDEAGVTIYHGDCMEVLPALEAETWHGPWGAGECVVVDPPWDQPGLMAYVAATIADETESRLVFTDARRIGHPLTLFGAPDWLFVWDTMNTWSTSPSQPVQQTKHCLWYGADYDRDAQLWGDAPPARNHPTTTQVPLDGRRLTDLWRESLRWLHNPSAGEGSAGTERFTERQGDPVMRHAKPVGWLRCLIGNTSVGPVLDPFMGSGSAIQAAFELGRPVIGIDVDERCCEAAVNRLRQGVLAL